MSVQPRVPKKYRKKKEKNEKSDKTRKNQLIGGALMMIIALTFILMWVLTPDYQIDELNNKYDTVIKYSSEGAVINYTDEEGLHADKWFDRTLIPAFEWLNSSTAEDAIILSWWDYGHGIKGYGERITIVRNPSEEILYSVQEPDAITEFDSNTDIEQVSLAFSTTNYTIFSEIMDDYDADYIFIGTYDILKASVMYNTTGLEPTDYVVRGSDDTVSFTSEGEDTMIGRMYLNQNIDLEIVYEDDYARIYEYN